MRRTIFILITIILFAQYAYAQQTDSETSDESNYMVYTLNDLYELALERAEQIKISEEDLIIAERGKDKALSGLLPTLSAFGDHTRYSESKDASSGFTLQPDYTTSWGLSLNQSFSLRGKEFTAFSISKKNIMKNWLDLSTVKEEYLLTVSTSYYDALKTHKALDIANANGDRLTKHRDAARKRLEVGEVTKTVLLRAEAELASAEAERIRAQNNKKIAKAVLKRTVGIKGDCELKETGNIDQDYLGNHNLQTLSEIALSERTEARAVELQKNISEDEVRYAKGSYWPTLSLEGVYFKEKNEPSSSFEVRERIYGGLRVDFPFFEGGLTRAEVREAKAKQRQAELVYEDMRKSIMIEVEDAYLNFMTQKGVLKSLEDQLTFARDNYNAVSKQFKYGLADSIDVMDANTLLVTAERELAKAEYDYKLAILKIEKATGTLLKKVANQSTKRE